MVDEFQEVPPKLVLPEGQEEGAFTINIPGASDFFILPIPGLQDKQIRKEQAERFKESRSPLPDAIKWIPTAINYLDDAQDLLFTALILGKPLLKRLPKRFIPVLGWVLTANDIMNYMVFMLGTATTGRASKAVRKQTKKFFQKLKLKHSLSVKIFMARTPWLSFSLQAAQASETVTGFGLRLGTLMGMVSDSVWGTIRLFAGDQVVIKGPPKSDFFSKAVRFLSQAHIGLSRAIPLNPFELATAISATNVAINELVDKFFDFPLLDRLKQMETTQVPVYEPWNPATIEALKELGIPSTGDLKNPSITFKDRPTYQEEFVAQMQDEEKFQEFLKRTFGPNAVANYLQLIYDEAGITAIETWISKGQVLNYEFDRLQGVFLAATEAGVHPCRPITGDEFRAWESIARSFAIREGRDRLNEEDMKIAALLSWGCWENRPPIFPLPEVADDNPYRLDPDGRDFIAEDRLKIRVLGTDIFV